jgi:hypothetical protein
MKGKSKKVERLEKQIKENQEELLTTTDSTRMIQIVEENQKLAKEVDRTKVQNAYNRARYSIMVDCGLKHTKYGWE